MTTNQLRFSPWGKGHSRGKAVSQYTWLSKGAEQGCQRGHPGPWFPYMHRHGFIRLFQAVNLCTYLVAAHASMNCRELLLRGWSRPSGCVCRWVPCRGRQLWGGAVLIWQGYHWPWSANPEPVLQDGFTVLPSISRHQAHDAQISCTRSLCQFCLLNIKPKPIARRRSKPDI